MPHPQKSHTFGHCQKVFHTVEKSSPPRPFSPKVFHAMEE
jgi:hypothetical protein